jgi:hypothetical protein
MSRARQLQLALDPVIHAAGGEFTKLSKVDDPYYFVAWDIDDNGRLCLYYGITARAPEARDNVKRVPLSEIANAITICRSKRRFDRSDFEAVCSVAAAAGPCGFAVVGRCMELLSIAFYDIDEHVFALSNPDRATELLQDA